MGESILSTVKNAAKLAVYDEIMMSVKNHHMPATILVDTALRSNEMGQVTCFFSSALFIFSIQTQPNTVQQITI